MNITNISLKKASKMLPEKFENSRRDEEKKILKIFKSFSNDAKILDVGCGFGWNIDLLKENGFDNITGVEINEKIIEKNKAKGFVCYNPEDFFENFEKEEFDIILMSHIIEHFNHEELKEFLEKYLKILKKGGSLIVVTPIMTKFFYMDFDHVKPYDPIGLSMFFSNHSQLQFYSSYKMKLENLYFRRSPFKLKNFRSLYTKKNATPIVNSLPRLVNFLLAVIFKISCGLVGYVSGWIGEYKKY